MATRPARAHDMPGDMGPARYTRVTDQPGEMAQAVVRKRVAQEQKKNLIRSGARAISQQLRNPPTGRNLLGGTNLGVDLLKTVGLHPQPWKDLASGAAWSFTHPMDRLMGRGRSAQELMAWVGPNKLFPNARFTAADPNFEIIRNKPGDPLVTIGGNLRSYEPLDFRASAARQMQVYNEMLRNAIKANSPAEAQLARNYRLAANARRQNEPLSLAFSVVEPGTRTPHASMNMEVSPEMTRVDQLAHLWEIQNNLGGLIPEPMVQPGAHVGQRVPNSVMLQLMSHALAPEKPVSSYFVNPDLKRMAMAFARRRGIPIIAEHFGLGD